MTIRELFKRMFGFGNKVTKRKPFSQNRYHPKLEALEDRFLPSDNVWIAPAPGPGFWGVASNWVNSLNQNDHHIPNSTDDINFGTYGGTNTDSEVDAGYTVNSLFMNGTYSGTLTIPKPVDHLNSINTVNSFTNNGGVVNVYDEAEVDALGTFVIGQNGAVETAAHLKISTGTVDDGGAIDVFPGGLLDFKVAAFGESLSGLILVETGATLIIDASNQINLNGTIDVQAGGNLVLISPGSIEIQGTLQGLGNGGFYTSPPPVPNFTTAVTADINYYDNYILTTDHKLTAAGIEAKAAALPPGSPTGISITTPTLKVDAGATMDTGPDSVLNLTGSGTTTISGTVDLLDTSASISTLSLSGANLTLFGDTSSITTSVTVNNPLTIDSASTVTIGGTQSQLNVSGSISVKGKLNLNPYATVNTNGNNLTIQGGTSPGVLNFNGGSSITVNVSELDNEGIINVITDPNQGTPSITGNLYNNGSLVFQDSSTITTALSVQGNYTQTSSGSLTMNIDGNQSGSNDQLSATGTITLGGTLTVNSNGALVPGTWSLLSGGTLSGAFATVNLPTPPSGDYWSSGPSGNKYNVTLNP